MVEAEAAMAAATKIVQSGEELTPMPRLHVNHDFRFDNSGDNPEFDGPPVIDPSSSKSISSSAKETEAERRFLYIESRQSL